MWCGVMEGCVVGCNGRVCGVCTDGWWGVYDSRMGISSLILRTVSLPLQLP